MSALSGLGLQLLAMLLLLGGVAAVLLRLGRRAPQKGDGPLELLAHLPLEGRRRIYLVRAGKRVVVVGSSEGGLSSLSDFDARELGEERSPLPSVPDLEARVEGVSAAELLGHGESPTPPRSAWRRGQPLEEIEVEGESFTLSRPRDGALHGEE